MIDGAESVGAVLEITDLTVIEMQLSAVPILPRLSGDCADVARELDLAHTAQHLAQDGPLLLHLEVVIHVLILAAAASPEIRARRGHARSGWCDHFKNAAAKQVVLRSLHLR